MGLRLWKGPVGPGSQLGAQYLCRQPAVEFLGAGLGVPRTEAGKGQGVAGLGHLDGKVKPAPGGHLAQQFDLLSFCIEMSVLG